MGDRTTVTLTVLTAHADRAGEIFDEDNLSEEASESQDGLLTHFVFYEVNRGNLDFLDELTAAGISYDSRWEDGSEFSAGVESMRFTPDGGSEMKEVYDTHLNPNIEKLIELIDDHKALRGYILAHIEHVTALDWDKQEEYSKLFRAKQLIS
jgi:hypothetical protein